MHYTYRTIRKEEKTIEVEVIKDHELTDEAFEFGVVELYEFSTPSLIASFSVKQDAEGFLAYINNSSHAGHTKHELITTREEL